MSMLKLGSLHVILDGDQTRLDRRLAQARKDFQGFGQRMKDMGLVAGAAIGAALAAGLVGALDLDKAQARFEAQLGNTAYAAEMGAIAGKVYARGFGESATAVNDAMRSVLTSGLLSEDATAAQIEAITAKAIALSDVFAQDVTKTSRAAGQMIRNGLAKNAEEALDLITRGFQQTGDHADDLMDTFSEYSTKFRDLGLSGADSLGLMNQALKAGARDSDTAADALKEFAIRAIDGTKTSADGYKMLGLSAEKMTAQIAKGGAGARAGLDVVLDRLKAMKDPVQQDAAAVALFGTKAEDLGDALFAMDLDTAAATIGTVTGAADKLGESLEQSASQKVEAFKRSAHKAFLETLAKAIPYVEKIVGWMSKHKDIVGPLVIGLGMLAAIIGTIVVVTKIWTAVQMALNIVMMLNPVGLVVLAVIALIAGIVLLWKHSEGFRNFFLGLWSNIWGLLKSFWSWITDTAAPALFDALTWPYRAAWDFIQWVWSMIVLGATTAFAWVSDKALMLVAFFTSLPKRIGKAVAGLWDGLTGSFRAAINWIIRKWNDFRLTLGGGNLLGMDIPSVTLNTPNLPLLDIGAKISQTGLAVVHQGERVMPASQVRQLERGQAGGSGSTGGTQTLELLISTDGGIRKTRKTVRIQGGRVDRVLVGA